jgi:FixJ family two-component response regulator
METGAVIHVVDDDESVRTAMRRLLAVDGFHVETYASADEFLAVAPLDGIGCVLLDLQLPGQDGLQCQRALAEANCPLPVVMITGHADIPSSVEAFKLGAVDLLTKPVDARALTEAVVRATAIGAKQVAHDHRMQEAREKLARLSPREREVFVALVHGSRNKEIASALGIRERTVKAHRASVMTKLDAHSTAHLARTELDAEMQVAPAT